jgi:hypothetical protein
MNRIFAKLPPPMQRTFTDDLRWAAGFLLGLVTGYLTLGGDDAGLLIGGLIGVTITIVGLNVARRLKR